MHKFRERNQNKTKIRKSKIQKSKNTVISTLFFSENMKNPKIVSHGSLFAGDILGSDINKVITDNFNLCKIPSMNCLSSVFDVLVGTKDLNGPN